MNNNSSAAFLYSPPPKQDTPKPAPTQPAPEPKKAENTAPPAPEPTKTQEKAPVVLSPEQLMEQVSGAGGDKAFWYLTYMTHHLDFMRVRDDKEQDKPGKIRMMYNSLCTETDPFSRLENITRTITYRGDEPTKYQYYWMVQEDKIPNCPSGNCTDSYPFCLPKMQAFIEYHCQKNGMKVEQVYQQILGDDFKQKPADPERRNFDIPAGEYNFLNFSCVVAAERLIKTDWIRLKENSDTRISYAYLPICEITAKSFIPMALEFYESQKGKHDFIRKETLREELCENRNCTGCLFPQCPDKVAAYILALAQQYHAEPLELCRFIAESNKIKGVSVRGNFKCLERFRDLDDVDFTPESRQELDKIVRYIINHCGAEGSKMPLLPFHLAIYTKDDKVADDIAQVFSDTVLYYNYMDRMRNCVGVQEYKFSQGGLSGLIDFIEKQEKPTLIHIKEMSLLGTQADLAQNQIMEMTRLNNLIREKESKLLIIVSGEKAKLDTALGAYSDFYHGTLHHKLTVSEMPTGKVVSGVLKNLEKDFTLEDGFVRQLEHYVISQYAETPLRGKAFIELVTQTILFNHFNRNFDAGTTLWVRDIPLASNRRSDEEIWRDLNGLTGLQTVKEEVRNIQQLLKLQKKMTALTSKTMQRLNMHMVFAGNPGTGKTTVARLLAEILYNLGYIRQNKLVEVSPKDLVGRYVGQTAPKTAAVCESAYDGVLFVDEAYELTVFGSNGADQFRSECITELIKQMEDNRDRLVVIFAGYTAEMRKLLDSNAGFASRIGKIILFEDYNEDQLVDIFVNLVDRNGMTLSGEAEDMVRQAIRRAQATEHFGNARYVRNLYEGAIREHARNTVDSEDPDVLLQISRQDIPFI